MLATICRRRRACCNNRIVATRAAPRAAADGVSQCRVCTLLVCDSCSSKKLTIILGSGGGSKRVRACDGCFNNTCRAREDYEADGDDHEHGGGGGDGAAAPTASPAPGAAKSPPGATALQKDPASLSKARFALFSGGGSARKERGATPPAAPQALHRASTVGSGLAGAASAAQQAGDALANRGEKLASLAERMEALNSQAALFQAEARKLREQQANKKWWEL